MTSMLETLKEEEENKPQQSRKGQDMSINRIQEKMRKIQKATF